MLTDSIPQLSRDDKWVYWADAITAIRCVNYHVDSEDPDYNELFDSIPANGKCSIARPKPYQANTDEYINKAGWQHVSRSVAPKGISIVEALAYFSRSGGVGKVLFQEKEPGFVYLMREIDGDNHCKIGRSTKVRQRLGSARVDNPRQIVLLHDFFSTDHYKVERQLHKQFASKRVKGEWFALTQDDIETIKSMCDERNANDVPYDHMDGITCPDFDPSNPGIPRMDMFYRLRDSLGLSYMMPDGRFWDGKQIAE